MPDATIHSDALPPAPIDLDTPQDELPPSLRDDPVNPPLALLLNAMLWWYLVLVFYQVSLKYLGGFDAPLGTAGEGAAADVFAWIAGTYIDVANPIMGREYVAPVFNLVAAAGGLVAFVLSMVLWRKVDLGEAIHFTVGLTLIAACVLPAVLGLDAIWPVALTGLVAMVLAKGRFPKA